MSKKNIKTNLVELTLENLHANLLRSKQELFNLRFQNALGEGKDTSRFRKARVEVARIQTELSKRLALGGK